MGYRAILRGQRAFSLVFIYVLLNGARVLRLNYGRNFYSVDGGCGSGFFYANMDGRDYSQFPNGVYNVVAQIICTVLYLIG